MPISLSEWDLLHTADKVSEEEPLDFIEVSQVITNYSAAGIPLETMWTDIGKLSFSTYPGYLTGALKDYMDERKIFTSDPIYFPLEKMREIVSYLHAHNQKYSKRSIHLLWPHSWI